MNAKPGDLVERAVGRNGIWRFGSCQIELRALLYEPPLSCVTTIST